jgi:cation diffusion facilitator CzcD-associated flavoprotein CzcO
MMSLEHFDVLIVGAGLSGVGAAYHLKTEAPGKSFAIFEARERLGGTWDLFRYPGIRSDSDMYTLGYAFQPWREAKAIADGPSILAYVQRVAAENGILEKIRYRRRVTSAAWSSETALWTVRADDGAGGEASVTCRFLLMCSGYYDYAGGHDPAFPGEADFAGAVVHPQAWPEGLDYAGKRVVVIGSGATAVTLVPEMARTAAHVVMLQRSPTYLVSRPAEDGFANWLRRRLPARLAYGLVRWRNVLLGMFFFTQMRKKPLEAKAQLVKMVRAQLGPDYDVETHFTPRYNPWDQRICLVPDADLFAAIRSGRAEVVTDQIERFTKTGLALASGREIPADLVVKATGLKLKLLGGMEVSVDGERRRLADLMTYKGMMFSDTPNLALISGYTNASWTLKADLISEYVCRLLRHMDKKGYVQCVPRRGDAVGEAPWLDFSSGYVVRAMAEFPKQGAAKPWKLHQNYLLDLLNLRYDRLEDGVMEFKRAAPAAPLAAPAPERIAAE